MSSCAERQRRPGSEMLVGRQLIEGIRRGQVTYLVTWEDESIGKDDILPPCGGEHDDLGNIIGRQRLDALIHLLRLLLIAVEPDDGELGFDLSRIDLDDPYPGGNQLLPERVGEAADSSFGGAVDGTAGVGLTASDGADVDDVAGATIGAGEIDGENGLGQVDEAGDVGVEHGGHVFLGNIRGPGEALDQSAVRKLNECTDTRGERGGKKKRGSLRIVHKHVDVPPFLWQRPDETPDLVGVADIELHRQDLDALSLLLNLVSELTKGVDTTSSEDETEVASRTGCACKLERGGTTDAGRGAGDEDGLAGQAGRGGGRRHAADAGEVVSEIGWFGEETEGERDRIEEAGHVFLGSCVRREWEEVDNGYDVNVCEKGVCSRCRENDRGCRDAGAGQMWILG